MKKQGYTLTELLVSVVLFVLLLVILTPSVKNMIDNSYHKAYMHNLSLLKSAAKNYTLRNNLKVDNGAQRIIFMTQLIDNGVITDILDPKTKESCTGYVIVNNGNEIYNFTPYMECGENYTSENYGATDTVPPVLTIIGDPVITLNVGEAYIDPGVTAIDNTDGDVSSNVVVFGIPNINVVGIYTINYSVEDSIGNTATSTRAVNIIDNSSPTIAFNPNGNTTYSKSFDTVINVTDLGGINNESLKYLWTTSDIEPALELFVNTFANNQTITTPAGITGSYYLWVVAKDVNNNQTITKSNVFNLDNTAPTITLNGDSNVTINQGTTYTDAGATASDNIDGDISVSIIATGTVNPNVVGTYTITYNVSDGALNAATSITRTVSVTEAADTTPPVITLNGNNPMTVYINDPYTDPGATATDDVDGDITNRITKTGAPKMSVIGSYTVTYKVLDTAGNQTIKTRTVNVISRPPEQ